ncbi:DUF4174 domain-containing protein [Enterovibrio makurazakiensis]|uniref:DUF4174 domain-containing protein n=1 Tax=Enterovibrio gelatinilyticus TaxID=2899819 RepID=A0ABT5QXV9_9GAMM|nr:DUF4174 domain-containing protein [Enterovibrio sp. ZSDZ42]MDD1792117.1 DUF4174 domain-containing protein [Enterovibrio sp. ZSDZ42]
MRVLNRLSVLLLLLASSPSVSYPFYGLIEPHRTLIFFAPSFDDKVRAFERLMLVHSCQIDDRDLHPVILNMQDLSDSQGLFSSQEILKLGQKYAVDTNEHIAVLIGKDGTEKFRWRQTVNINELVDVIDEMPMRKAELKLRGNRCSI